MSQPLSQQQLQQLRQIAAEQLTARQPAGAPPVQPIQPSMTMQDVGDRALSVAETAGRSLLSGAAGFVSGPYELPALAYGGYQYLTGDEPVINPLTNEPILEMGKGYEAVGDFLFGDYYKLEDPDSKPWWERGLYYGGEAVVGGPTKLVRTLIQGAAGGLASEENAALGVGISVLPTGRTGKKINPLKAGPEISKIDKQDSDALALGRQLTEETGIQETRGMQEYRAALELPDGSQEQLNALAKARETLAVEETGRRRVEALGGFNQESWIFLDRQRQRAVENQLQKLAEATGQADPAVVVERVAQAFNKWEKSRIEDFKARNKADFDKIPDDIYFDMTSVLNSFDAIAEKYRAVPVDADDFTKARAESARLALEGFTRRLFDENGNQRDLTANEIQDIMSELGDLAWKGSGPGFEDLTPGVAKAMARELLYAFKGVIKDENLVGPQKEAAEALINARDNFNARLDALNVESNRSFIKFGIANLDSATPDQLLAQLRAITQDTSTPTRKGQIEILTSLIRKEDPELWGQVKQLIFEDTFRGLRDEQGLIDLAKLQRAVEDLRKNKLLFGDKGAVNAFDGFIRQLQGVFARNDRVFKDFADVTSFYRQGKAGAEALGAALGPKGRYLGELAVKVGDLLRKGRFDPKMAAYFANNPDARIALIKSLKGEFKDLKPAQIKALQGAALLGRIYLTGGIPSIYLSRNTEEQ